MNLLHLCSERSKFGGGPEASFLLLEEWLAPCCRLCSVVWTWAFAKPRRREFKLLHLSCQWFSDFVLDFGFWKSKIQTWKTCLHWQQCGLCCLQAPLTLLLKVKILLPCFLVNLSNKIFCVVVAQPWPDPSCTYPARFRARGAQQGKRSLAGAGSGKRMGPCVSLVACCEAMHTAQTGQGNSRMRCWLCFSWIYFF